MFRKSVVLVVLITLLVGFNSSTHAQAAKTQFKVRIENVSGQKASAFKTLGVFSKAVGATQPGPATPGNAFEFTISAASGDRLAFETMFGQSNDWFFGPDEKGIPLYDSAGKAISGDFSNLVRLWDAGTEVDEELGKGPNQAPRQPAPNTGVTENGLVRPVDNSEAKFTIPNAADYIKLTITAQPDNQFRVRIENISSKAALPTPIAPGVYVITNQDAPFFDAGKADRGQGLEGASEDGNPLRLAQTLGTTDKQVHLSPGVFVIHTASDPLFTVGQPDRGQGLEAQAEDGNPAPLGEFVKTGKFPATGVFNTAVGAAKVAPAGPGQAFEFTFDAQAGDFLALTTMFGDTNDLFFGPDGYGIALFNAMGKPVSGDVTLHIRLWDAGTEVNQEPFVGPDQAPRQAAPNTGKTEGSVVRLISDVADGFTYPSVFGSLKVTITAQGGEPMNMMNPAMMGTMQPTMQATTAR